MQTTNLQLLKKVIRDFVQESLNERKKPGGPITDYGALRILNKKKADAEARKALKSAGGDVSDAAQAVGVADRTFYHYLETDKKLEKVRQDAENASSSGEDETPKEPMNPDIEAQDKK